MRGIELPVVEDAAHLDVSPAGDRQQLLGRGLRLEFVSIGWNLVEGVVAIAAGIAAGSVALVGFGVDSFVESSSAAVIVWRIFAEMRNNSAARVQSVERISQRLVATSLVLLGIYVMYESVTALAWQERPDASLPGVIIAALSLTVMWWLARSIRSVGQQLHSHSIESDSAQTLACWWMSLSLLVGLTLNLLFGWWWADPAAGIVISIVVFREGWNSWQGKECCGL
ncbi:MAG: cation transporter [Dehalococcoidia bacterium]|jgi:divalent metal cation (Fe/Co/Zn/Cd) transporter